MIGSVILGTVRDTRAAGGRGETMLSYNRTVEIEWGDCDASGLLHTERYFALFDGNMWHMLERCARVAQTAFARDVWRRRIPDCRPHDKFLAPSMLGDVLHVESTILELRRSSFDVRHQARKDGELRAESLDTRVWVGRSPDRPAPDRSTAAPGKAHGTLSRRLTGTSASLAKLHWS